MKYTEAMRATAEKIIDLTGYGGKLHVNDILPDLKDLLQDQEKEFRAMVEGMKIKRNIKGCFLKGDDGNTYIMKCEYGNCEHAGFNRALSDVLRRLDEGV